MDKWEEMDKSEKTDNEKKMDEWEEMNKREKIDK